MTEFTDLGTCLVEELCREWTCTDTGTVSLHDTINITDAVRTDTQTDAGTRTDGIGRSNERIRTEVNIEHGTLSTLAENILAGTEHLVDFHLTIDELELLQVFDTLHPGLLNLCDIEVGITETSDGLEMSSLVGSILLLEIVEDIAYAETGTAHLICISRTDTLTGSTHLVLTLRSLDSSIEHTMSRHDEMSLLRDEETTLEVVTALLQILSFAHEEVWSQDYAITNDVHLTTLEDTRRDRAEHILLAFELEGMTCVRTTLETSNDIILRGDHIRLTQTEFAIMKLFMENPGRALSREEILHAVWGADYNGEVKIVDVNIRRLRIKIEDDATEPEYITTVWGYGYKWGY